MTDYNAELATLIGSRICHDLIGPVGAISNGLELLELTGGIRGPEFALVQDSVQNSIGRLRFFRMAYGAAGDQMVGHAEVNAILDQMTRGSRMTINWRPSEPQPRANVRLAFLAIQCCETAMPTGGTITCTSDGPSWTVAAHADRSSLDPELRSWLEQGHGQQALAPSQVQFALMPLLAREHDRKITVLSTANSLTLHF